MISPRITLCSVDIFTMTLKDAQENINNNNNKNYDSNNWPTSRELFAGWFSNSITGESVNCKLTGCRRLFCCRQVEVSNLPVRVYVLSEKDTEQVDDVDITKPLSFFRFIDWWTGINKRALLYHFLFLCQVAVLSSPPVFILHSLCTSLTSHFILWCSCHPSASCISPGMSSWGLCCRWWNGVWSVHKKKKKRKKKQAHGRKNTTLCPPPSCSFSLSLPQHVIQTCVSDHAHAHTHMRAHSCGCCTLHLTHTVQTEDFMVFLKLENKEVHRNRKSPCYHLCSQMLLAWKRNHWNCSSKRRE